MTRLLRQSEGALKLVIVVLGLEILDIGGNPIGNAGVRLIAKLITLEETLVEVHVDHVGFNEEGAHELLRAMEMRLNNGQPMRTIWAHGNDISDDFLTSLTNLCRNRHENAAIDGGSSDEDDCDHNDRSHTSINLNRTVFGMPRSVKRERSKRLSA